MARFARLGRSSMEAWGASMQHARTSWETRQTGGRAAGGTRQGYGVKGVPAASPKRGRCGDRGGRGGHEVARRSCKICDGIEASVLRGAVWQAGAGSVPAGLAVRATSSGHTRPNAPRITMGTCPIRQVTFLIRTAEAGWGREVACRSRKICDGIEAPILRGAAW